MKMIITSLLNDLELTNKRVLLRADLNVPLRTGQIMDDYRLRMILPTINLILQKGGKIVLITHIGRPKQPDPALSTKQLIPWFEKNGYQIAFSPTIEDAHKKIAQGNQIVLLENIRFFPGEKEKDKQFAQSLAALADYYVNDAFATMHRDEASITIVPRYFPPENRTIGLLAELELNHLNRLLYHPQRPFAFIIGGGKVKDKLPLLLNLLDKIDMLFLCPAIVFTFLKASGQEVGKSLVNNAALNNCAEIINAAKTNNVKIFFPIDFQIALDSFDGPLSYVPANEIPDNGVGISIGPQTTDFFASEFKKAKTILYNGLMGDIGREQTLTGACSIFNAMATTKAHTIIAGGDSVAAAYICSVTDKIEWCSTGGGATIDYLTGKTLPGLAALE
jgi:phosphoglycerate kinase